MKQSKKTRITITIDEKAFNEMKALCEEAGQKVSSVINILVHRFIRDNKQGNVELIKQKGREDNNTKKS